LLVSQTRSDEVASDKRRLRDIVRFGSWSETQVAIRKLSGSYAACCVWIKSNCERTNRNFVLYSLVAAGWPYLDLAGKNLTGPIPVLALSTRALYELHLRTRHVLQSEENLKKWIAETSIDTIEFLQGILTLGEPKEAADLLNFEVERQRSLAQKHNLDLAARPISAGALARAVGRQVEHDAFFKLFSKLVHPSALLVNGTAEKSYGFAIRNTLVIHLQLFAHDMLGRIVKDLEVSDRVLDGKHRAPAPGSWDL
jgi:hypothetical protein